MSSYSPNPATVSLNSHHSSDPVGVSLPALTNLATFLLTGRVDLAESAHEVTELDIKIKRGLGDTLHVSDSENDKNFTI